MPGHEFDMEQLNTPIRYRVLITDDSQFNREYLSDILGDTYDIVEADSGPEAIDIMEREGDDISLLLLDIHMPDMDGFGVLAVMNERGWIDSIPVIIISSDDDAESIERAYNLGATDYFPRNSDMSVLQHRAANTILLYAKQRELTAHLAQQMRESAKKNEMMVDILSHIVEFRNGESGLHVIHIRKLTEVLLYQLIAKTDRYHLDRDEIALISTASALHDIGKIAIPGSILNKPGKLTDDEFAIMKTHSMIGATVLDGLIVHRDEPLVKRAYEICRWHHERYDGRGYPDGLKGEEIPISAQVVSIADVYDALTSERVYKKAFTHEKAIEMICAGESGSFSPLLLECLMECADEIKHMFTDSPLPAEGSQDSLQDLADEILRREELATGKTSELVAQEKAKRQVMSSIIDEIQFDYKVDPACLTLPPDGAQFLGLSEVTPTPLTSPKIIPMLDQDGIRGLREAIRAVEPGGDPNVEYTCQLVLNGETKWVQFNCRVLWAGEDTLRYQGVFGKMTDIQDMKTRMDTLEQQATHDPLTGLPNRRHAQDKGTELLKTRTDLCFTMAMVDLDGFKEINDTYGHQFGDSLLSEIARRLQALAEQEAVAVMARIGGDEFMVFTGGICGSENDMILLNRIQEAIREPIGSARVTASIGAARSRVLGRDYDALYHAADQALYTVKRNGKNAIRLYDDSMKNIFPDPSTPVD